MSKENNIQDLLRDVADAIREKKGTEELISPQNFSEEIKALGSERPSVEWNDVNFYDYDGTRLYSYTWDDAMAMTELPPLPTAKGLICQEWNYTLEDIKAQNGRCDIGATYITDDGKTRLYIRIAAPGRMNVPLYFNQSAANGVTIDWGDGSSVQTLSDTGNVNTAHTYTEIGDYCISLTVNNGTLGLGHNSSSYCIMGPTDNTGKVYCNMLQKIEIGKGVTSIDNSAFYYCYSLSSIVIPKSVTSIGSYVFYNCCFLLFVSIPDSVTSINSYVFYFCYSLSSIIIPKNVTNIGSYAFYTCSSLSSVIIPEGTTSIATNAFNSCYSLPSIIIPDSVTSIISNSFKGCSGMAFYDFRGAKSVPTLQNSNAFTSISSDCKIVVPDSLYDSWIAATNWSTYASNIVKASEFVEPTTE